MNRTMLRLVCLGVVASACSSSSTPGGDGGVDASRDGAPPRDGRIDAQPEDAARDAGPCEPLPCAIDCAHGFARDDRGCPMCACLPHPTRECSSDDDCVLAVNGAACCACVEAYTRERLEADTCLVEPHQTAPDRCEEPNMCEGIACGACPPPPSRAICEAGTCETSETCPEGEHAAPLRCVPDCTSHADCVMAADYGSCCGGCESYPASVVDDDPCLAQTAEMSECSPAPRTCEGFGCPPPPADCTSAGPSAVCMDDGRCAEGRAGGGCPFGSTDVDGVCVSS